MEEKSKMKKMTSFFENLVDVGSVVLLLSMAVIAMASLFTGGALLIDCLLGNSTSYIASGILLTVGIVLIITTTRLPERFYDCIGY